MELLGPNIEELMEFCRGSLSPACTIVLAQQFLSLIEYFHQKGFIHRDIKPENFMMGREGSAHTAYIIDYGLAKCYCNPETKEHIPYKENKPLTGTARYASLNTHMGMEQSRRDDLECLAFTLVYISKGVLPWQEVQARDKDEKHQKIFEKKKNIPLEVLCKGLPIEFKNLFIYCRGLKFEEEPDYSLLKKSFEYLFHKKKYNKKFEYDWDTLKLDFDYLLDRDYSISQSKEVYEEDPLEEDKSISKCTQNKSTFFTGSTTLPRPTNVVFTRPKKQNVISITQKMKLLKEEFMVTGNNSPNEIEDEIPDEKLTAINKVKEFIFIENSNNRFKFNKKKYEVKNGISYMKPSASSFQCNDPVRNNQVNKKHTRKTFQSAIIKDQVLEV